MSLSTTLLQASELGIRLEIVNGLPIWEAQPVYRHQKHEVVSKGYEAKDLEIGPPFYLSQGVKDVIVFDPLTLLVLHVRRDNTVRQVSPVTVDLECGCRVLV
ncbi:MAG: hypothetical protein D3925_17470 [Candidatus Electrothrix sp. AR5]|nr:hypothetical protein [Candidatus Electrothrix sp. AR5]